MDERTSLYALLAECMWCAYESSCRKDWHETSAHLLQATETVIQIIPLEFNSTKYNILDDLARRLRDTCIEVEGGDPDSSVILENSGGTVIHERQNTIDDYELKSHVSMNDIVGLDGAKQALKEALILPVQFPHLFNVSRKPWCRILLYGPPGTGKTKLAHSISSAAQSKFYSISSCNLISSWVGESEKLIAKLFNQLRSQGERSILFIDEVDSLCRQRSSKEEEHSRRIKNEILKQLNEIDCSINNDLFLICATNCPWELDSAFLRRLQKRIYIPLPNLAMRVELLRMSIGATTTVVTEQDWLTLGQQTTGFSGSDLVVLANCAAMQPVRELSLALYWRFRDGSYRPCDISTPGAISASLDSLPTAQVQTRNVMFNDFQEALKVSSKTVGTLEIEKFNKFTEEFGQRA